MAVEEFKPKRFTAAHKHMIKQANDIIAEYQKAGYKLTLRQIHYQFVARDWYENIYANYKKLGNVLNAARLAGRVDWDAFDDPTRQARRITVFDKPEEAVQGLAKTFKLDPWEDQPVKRRIEVWVEKDAATSTVRPSCNDLRITYFSCRGYSSSSALYEGAQRLKWYKENGYEVLVLYLGDHDPSGCQMTDSTIEKVNMLAGTEIDIRRIALTMDQIKEYNPPEQFAKEKDSRTPWYIEQFGTEDCWELDALKPQVIDKMIRDEVEPLIDREAWDATLEREQEHLATLKEIISNWDRTKAAPDMHKKLLEFAQDYDVEAKPINDEGEFESGDSATLEMFIDESQEVLRKHGIL